jgi:hypothetical protein
MQVDEWDEGGWERSRVDGEGEVSGREWMRVDEAGSGAVAS